MYRSRQTDRLSICSKYYTCIEVGKQRLSICSKYTCIEVGKQIDFLYVQSIHV